MENQRMATQSQILYLQSLGYTGSTEGLTSDEASNLIGQLKMQKAQAQSQNDNYNIFNEAPQHYENNPQPQPQHQATPNQQMQKFTNKDVAVLKDSALADALMENLNELATDGALYIPENYSVGNALKSAMSKILTSDQASKLLACTTESKKQALTEYIVQGLDAAKTQAYFIPYGDKMTMMRSYFGDVAVVKRTGLVQDVYAVVIYKGDEIEIGFDDYGRKTLIKHTTKFENQDNEIVGAYAVAVGVNDYKCYEFMTRKELEASWNMSKTRDGKFLTNYKQEAAKRTVIRRLVKMLFNTSLNTTEEQTALIGSYNRTTPDEYDNNQNPETTIETVNDNQKKKTASKKIIVEDTPEQPTSDEEWLGQ